TEAHSVDDIAAIVVGHGLRVRDLATVTPGTEDRVSIISGNGRPVAQLNITRQLGGNTLAIADSVAGVARALADTLPPGVHLSPHRVHGPSPRPEPGPDRGHPRRDPGAALAGHNLHAHDRRRLPAARPAPGRGRPVLPRVADHAHDRRARVARTRVLGDSAPQRALPHVTGR